jgi:hypothetical protein
MQGEYARLFEMGYRAGRGMGRLATAAHFIAHAKDEQANRQARAHERDEERKERALARARDGDLVIVHEAGGIRVCGQDRTVLYLDEVPGWPNFTRWVCSTCGRERLNADEEL